MLARDVHARRRYDGGMPRRGRRPPHAYNDDARGPRLQRVMADAGVGSRRRCEELIAQGMVSINGAIVDTLPVWVDPSRDRIEVEGRVLPRPERHVYVMLYKPKGFVSTNADPEGRPRAIDIVQHPSGARLYPVGRLDIDSSGLLLLTNDGELANRLTHPRYEIHKIYEVTVAGFVPDGDLAHLEEGIYLPTPRGAPGAKTERSSLTIVKRDRERTHLLMELTEGRNRQIRRMLQRLGHPVKKLRRTQMGPLRLKGLAIGEWRDLTAVELSRLRADAFRSPEERLEDGLRRQRERERERKLERGGERRFGGGGERRAERSGDGGGERRSRAGSSSRSERGVERRAERGRETSGERRFEREPARGRSGDRSLGRSGPFGPHGPDSRGRKTGAFKHRSPRESTQRRGRRP